jgi:hypothetical protein
MIGVLYCTYGLLQNSMFVKGFHVAAKQENIKPNIEHHHSIVSAIKQETTSRNLFAHREQRDGQRHFRKETHIALFCLSSFCVSRKGMPGVYLITFRCPCPCPVSADFIPKTTIFGSDGHTFSLAILNNVVVASFFLQETKYWS